MKARDSDWWTWVRVADEVGEAAKAHGIEGLGPTLRALVASIWAVDALGSLGWALEVQGLEGGPRMTHHDVREEKYRLSGFAHPLWTRVREATDRVDAYSPHGAALKEILSLYLDPSFYPECMLDAILRLLASVEKGR